jgi:hypothetical protein
MFLLVAKEKLVNVRLTPKTHDEFKIACELRGASMSSLLHQFIVRTIREEKDLTPSAFTAGYHQVPRWTAEVQPGKEVKGNVEPIPDERFAHLVPEELTDETAKQKQKPIRKRVGKR